MTAVKKKNISILIVDDHAVVRAGLRTIINCETDMTVIAEAENGEDAISLATVTKPDVIVLDLMMPKMNGVEATRVIHEKNPSSHILILTTFGTSEDLSSAIDGGAAGALMKDAPNDELLLAIRTLARGERYFHGEIAKLINSHIGHPSLTPRQIEILQSCTMGYNTDDIAQQLGISPNSVKKHFELIFSKLGAGTRAEAITIAIKHQLLKV